MNSFSLYFISGLISIVLSQPRGPVQFTCERQPYKSVCPATGFPAQFSLRWYLKDGKCCSYPWGHCKGEDEIASEPAIRYKEDCEAVCIRGELPRGGPGGIPGGPRGPGGVRPGFPSRPGGGPLLPGQRVQKSCERIPYKATCTRTGFPSQFTLRWYLKDGKCCSYPWGHCKGEDEVANEPSIRTKEECEERCLGRPSSRVNPGGGPGPFRPGSPSRPVRPGAPGNQFPGSRVPGGRPSVPGRPGLSIPVVRGPVRKSCERIPYKAICGATGFPSQFTLRWYVKDGQCCSYPWGHCKGEDEVANEPAIRTKEDCECTCLNRCGPGGVPLPPPSVPVPHATFAQPVAPRGSQRFVPAPQPVAQPVSPAQSFRPRNENPPFEGGRPF